MRVVITGSSSGIGRATALKFLDQGHIVIGLDVDESTISNEGYFHHKCDVSKNLPEISDIDIIILSAGTAEENDAIEVNLTANINIIEKYCGDLSLKSILFVASSSARNGAEFPRYAASKGGLVSYMKYLANNLASRGITVNSVSPGGVITPMNKHILEDKEKYQKVLDEALLKKWATAEEIADWIYFITVVNKSMTGEDILIDNGEMLKSNFIW